MVRSKFRCVVVAAAVAGAAVTLASSAVPAHAQGAELAASRSSATVSLDHLGSWSRLAGWLTDLWNDGLGLVVAADEAPAPPENLSCTGDCDRGHGVDPNG